MNRKRELIFAEVERRVASGAMTKSNYAKFLAEASLLDEVYNEALKKLAGIITAEEYDKFVALLLMNSRAKTRKYILNKFD